MSDNTEHEEIMRELAEIKEVLIGTYKEKGIISRINTLEKYLGVIGVISMTAITGVVSRMIMLMIG